MEKNNKITTYQLCQAALCVALTCISAYIAIPVPFTPIVITAQTFVINLTALLLKPKYAVLTQIIYTLIGIVGLPVFSGGKAGIGTLAGPTGGYIIGFIAAVCLISLAKRGKCSFKRYLLITIGIGIPVIYLFGTVFMAFQVQKSIWALLTTTVFPFIPGDIIKCTVSSGIAVQLNRILRKRNLLD